MRGISRERNDTSWGGIIEERGEKEMKDNKVLKVEDNIQYVGIKKVGIIEVEIMQVGIIKRKINGGKI